MSRGLIRCHEDSSDVTRHHRMSRGLILSHLFPSEHVVNHHPALGAACVNELLTRVGHGGEVTPEGHSSHMSQMSHHKPDVSPDEGLQHTVAGVCHHTSVSRHPGSATGRRPLPPEHYHAMIKCFVSVMSTCNPIPDWPAPSRPGPLP